MNLRIKTILIAILGLHFLLAGVYWHYTPYGVPPDERAHGRYLVWLEATHELPVMGEADPEYYESHQPPLYYILGMPLYDTSIPHGFIPDATRVRLLSMILGALSILVIYRAVMAAFGDDRLALGAAGFTAFLPTHVMLSSMVSNDILAELIFGLALLLMVSKPSMWNTLALGVVLGLGLVTKTTCLLLFPAAILAFILVQRRPIKHVAAIFGISLIIGGWWLARNQILYGDFLAMKQFMQAFEHTAKPAYWLSHGFTPAMYWVLVGLWTFASFWGVFGHMNLFMPTWVYVCLGVATIAAKIGWFKGVRSFPERRIVLLYVFVIALVVLVFVRFNISFFQAQGRYLYPAILPLSVGWVLGIRSLLPKRIHSWTPYLAMAIPLAAQISALATLGGS